VTETVENAPGPVAQADEEIARIDRELTEIALLDQQARTESSRLEQRRVQAADKLAAVQDRADAEPGEAREATNELMTLTRRSAMMEAQVEVLEGKQKALMRSRERIAAIAEAFRDREPSSTDREAPTAIPATGDPSQAFSRAILTAQEDLRRDIARAMHDGPAQSMTNVLLQAQIVRRLVARDPEQAAGEAQLLMDMVEKTLDATKTFIFEVRPMVLDDLGLVPTLRRTARDRGRQGLVPIEFDSLGADRRLAPETESVVFRIIDDAVAGFIETHPARVSIRLDWSDADLHARVRAVRPEEPPEEPAKEEPVAPGKKEGKGRASVPSDLPPALAAMIDERRESEQAARAAAAEAALLEAALPARIWADIQQRAATIGLDVALSEDGRCLDVILATAERGA